MRKRMKFMTLSVFALTMGMAGGALAGDSIQWPNPQSHDRSLSLDSEVRWKAPKTPAQIEKMYAKSINRVDVACTSQGNNNTQSSNGSHLTQGDGCL